MNKDKEVHTYSCSKCAARDTDRMVQCDNCDRWYHHECVEWNSGLGAQEWNCSRCTETTGNEQATLISFPTPGAASSPAVNIEKGVPKVMNPTLEAISRPSTQATTSSSSVQAKMAFNIDPLTPLLTVNKQVANDTVSMQSLRLKMLEEERELKQEYLRKKYEILNSFAQGCTGQPENVATSNHLTSNNFQFIDYPSSSANTNFSRPIEPDHARQDCVGSGKVLTRNDATPYVGPTPSQLAARHAIPKELPIFSGDPEEWPIFISSFESSTEIAGYSNGENLIRLQASLKGKAKEMVKTKLLLPSLVPEIIHTLKMCFGRPEHIIERLIEKARSFPPPRDKLETLIEYALCVQNICSTMEVCHLEAHLSNPMLVKELVDKLSSQHKMNWAMHAKPQNVPIVKAFSSWLYSLAEAASEVVSPVFTKKGVMNTHISSKMENKHTCYLCQRDHLLKECKEFEKLPIDKKWNLVRTHKLCKRCLNNHRGNCRRNKCCNTLGCKAMHHPLLHNIRNDVSNRNMNNSDVRYTEAPLVANQIVNAHDISPQNCSYFRIIPIALNIKNKIINTYAFLDEGSSVSLIDKKFFESLNVKGQPEPLCLQWTGDTNRVESDSVKIALKVANVNIGSTYTLRNVRTVRNLNLPRQSIRMNDLKRQYPYLSNLPIESYENAQPMILIGTDNWKLAVPLKVREGSWRQPIATKCRLGWSLQGGSDSKSKCYNVNFHLCDCSQNYDELHRLVKESFAIDSCNEKVIYSEEDEKALKILNSTCVKVNGKFEVGLLWRSESLQLPDNYQYALRRSVCLKRKCDKSPNLKMQIQEQIDNLLVKGYARTVTDYEMSKFEGRVWYLPIFIALNPNKPGKIRLVWDAAAKAGSSSLNDFLLSGPDLLKSLTEILMCFRLGRIAVCGDIAEMFHQITVRQEDMHVQRFLWWKDSDKEKPTTFVMKALTFGTTCAPCIAHYVRNKNADCFRERFPRAVEAIEKYHYVDDFIDSVDTEDKAIELATRVKAIHASGGFNIRNWVSNSTAVLKSVGEKVTDNQEPLLLGSDNKVLGMYWDPNRDVFKYNCRFPRLKRNVLEDVAPTKREALQVLMSIFDPLGLLSCWTIGLKILLQETWRSGIGWDEEFSGELRTKWQKWKSLLPTISSIEIPRCYSQILKAADDIQLHTFVDASEHGYAAVCYLKIRKGRHSEVAMVAAKSKVAPLNPLSIPRLELQAAVLGVRLAESILKIERITISSKVYWSDSKTVLRWLKMDPRGFQQFVMHRVGEILEKSDVSNWNWVPSKYNPADLATKTKHINQEDWFQGPSFLKLNEEHWPRCDDLGSADNLELRATCLHVQGYDSRLRINVEYFSDWRRLYRAVSTFLIYVEKLRCKVRQQKLTLFDPFDYSQKAKNLLYQHAQFDGFSQEISNLRSGKKIEKSSKLIGLNIFLDETGLLRSKSRVEFLNNINNPIILPGDHYVTFLIVKWFHESAHHKSHEMVINNIRCRFYIPRLRVLFKNVRKNCQLCKNRNAVPEIPQMAPLPPARLAVLERPFTCTGIDYFGPIMVSLGRRREKRWGVLFTCLTVRAVHIEIAHSLDTSSCIMCIENFIARRGVPREFYTDNGTNFKSAKNVVCRSEETNVDYLRIAIRYDNIKWRFNPPSAPHMGGAWERLIRSTKSVLASIMPSMNFNDETLRSALAQVEFMLNARPLTFVSLESCDDEALTPNHLLLGSSSGFKPMCSYGSVNLRQQYKQTKLFIDRFWQRWVKEYAPTLTRRSKWFDKREPVQLGDVVVVVDESLPRNCWPKGIVTDRIMARDGQVRRVTVKTQFGTFERPVAKIAVLDVGKDLVSYPLTGERMLPTKINPSKIL